MKKCFLLFDFYVKSRKKFIIYFSRSIVEFIKLRNVCIKSAVTDFKY